MPSLIQELNALATDDKGREVLNRASRKLADYQELLNIIAILIPPEHRRLSTVEGLRALRRDHDAYKKFLVDAKMVNVRRVSEAKSGQIKKEAEAFIHRMQKAMVEQDMENYRLLLDNQAMRGAQGHKPPAV